MQPDVLFPTAETLVDLERYPLLDLQGARGQACIAQCREQLALTGCCELEGFLLPDAVRFLAEEAQGLSPLAYHSTVRGTPYLEPEDTALPADHPRRTQDTTSLGAVAYDQIPEGARIRQLYEWDPLLRFLGQALNKESFFRYGDPLGGLNLAVMKAGDYLRWHFDQTDFVVSLAIQSSEAGGNFEYVPLIRSGVNENYGAIQKLLRGDPEGVVPVPMRPGTLVLFEGRYSIHRVTPITGKRDRLVALLGYDTRPDARGTEHLYYMRYGRKPSASL